MARSGVMLSAGVMLLCLLAGAQFAESAVSCGKVVSLVSPCFNYLRAGGVLPQDCCKGVLDLHNSFKTTPDRQASCGCLKQVSGSNSGMKAPLVQGLPGKCGVKLPYTIGPNMDCSKVK